ALAAPLQGRPQLLDFDEGVGVFAVVEQQRGDVLAVPAAADRAGAVGAADGAVVEGHRHAVGVRRLALAAALDGRPLHAQVAPDVAAQVRLSLLNTRFADVPQNLRLTE